MDDLLGSDTDELTRLKRRPIYPEYEGYTLPPNMMRKKRLQQLHRSLVKMEKQSRRDDIRKEKQAARVRDQHIRKLNRVHAFLDDEGIDNERDLVEQYEKMRRPHPTSRGRTRSKRDAITIAEGGTKVSSGDNPKNSAGSKPGEVKLTKSSKFPVGAPPAAAPATRIKIAPEEILAPTDANVNGQKRVTDDNKLRAQLADKKQKKHLF